MIFARECTWLQALVRRAMLAGDLDKETPRVFEVCGI
jgi:hypothetical protein